MSLHCDRASWTRVRLGDVVANVNEYFSHERDGVLPYVAGPHIIGAQATVTTYGSTDEETFPPTFKRKFKPGDLLLHSRGIEKLAAVDREGVTGEKLFVLRSLDQNRLHGGFLLWALMSERAQRHMKDNFTGSVNKFLNWGPLASLEFDLPPLHEQESIADLFSAIEDHRRSLAASLADVLSTRSRWFQAKLAHGVASYEWRFENVPALVTSGPTNGKSARSNDEQRGVPTLSISAIRDGRVLGGSSLKYMEVDSNDVVNFQIEKDDFLIVRGNGNKHLTGKGGVAAGGLPVGCVYPDLLIRLRFDSRIIITAFASEQWNSAQAHNELIRRAKSTNGIWKINGQDIKSHRLVVPPLPAQRELLEGLSVFGAAASTVRAELAATERLRQSALAEIFGGK